eukprot:TRINITY_DN20742_c0_g1_i1.p1 TRINITY_DN20742_c0_g1~~TRINITY_DN20742_c0_g1_i1.p1  ORF type:complete len:134 (+),score=23.17 TRINITY_DN20742_c0_g1_i1:20-421(+)
MSQNKRKKAKNSKNKRNVQSKTRNLEFAEAGQDYALVNKKLGNCRFEVYLPNSGKTVLATLRGNMRKRVWTNPGDYVLVQIPKEDPDKVYICHKYSMDEVIKLKSFDEIPSDDNDQLFGATEEKEGEGEVFLL